MSGSKKLRREAADYTASFFLPGKKRGEPLKKLDARNEDLERQTFADETFDLVITQDVFEHLFRPDLAIAEIARTLKPGGAHVCTVPICLKSAPSARRALRREDGTVEHLATPVYHGNPIDETGSLVTVDYGYDIADYFDRSSGLNTTIVLIDDLSRGIHAEYIEVLVSRKPSGPSGLDFRGAALPELREPAILPG